MSGERLIVSVAIALALLSLVCTLWGCRNCWIGGASGGGAGAAGGRAAAAGAPAWRGSSLSHSPWKGAFERYADSETAAVANAPASASAAVAVSSPTGTGDSASAGVVASAAVVVPPLALKTRDNETSTNASRALEQLILRGAGG